MPNMYPTMISDPSDRNRRFTGEVGDTWPQSLKWGYRLLLAAAVLMLVTGLMLLKSGVHADIDPEVRGTFRGNLFIVSLGNIVLGLCLAGAASFFERGSKAARRWAAGFALATIFLNFAGFFVGVSGTVSFVIVALVAFAMFAAFRPAANAYVDAQSGDLWRGVK